MSGRLSNIDPRLLGEGMHGRLEEAAENGDETDMHLGYNPQLVSNQRTYDPELYHDRRENQDILKKRFENIFAKYERNFEGVGDEIDLATGDIVVNNGHVQNMRNEGDTGARSLQGNSHSRQGVNTQESDSDSGDEQFENVRVGDSTLHSDGVPSRNTLPDTPALGSFRESGDDSDSTGSLFEPDELSVNEIRAGAQASRRPIPAPHAQKRNPSLTPFAKTPAYHNTMDLLHQIPGLENSIYQLQHISKAGQPIDPNDLQDLGNSIARHVSAYVSHGAAETPSVPPYAQFTDSAWAYPLLPGEGLEQRKPRSSNRKSSRRLQVRSPTRESLWAPIKHPVRRKYKRAREKSRPAPIEHDNDNENDGDYEEVSEFYPSDTAAHAASGLVSKSRTTEQSDKICRNCDFTGETTWRLGMEGEDLCNACGMYFYRYGLHKPSAVPSDSESDESDFEMDDPVTDFQKSGVESRFSTTEDSLLLRLKEIELLPWPKIARHFPGRTPYSIQCRYSKFLAGRPGVARSALIEQGHVFHYNADGTFAVPKPRATFTDADDDLLLKLRDEDELDWPSIALKIHGHGPEALEKRYRFIVKEFAGREEDEPFAVDIRPQRKKKKKQRMKRKSSQYTKAEDEQLIKLREEEKMPWMDLAVHFPGRTFGSLQKRYTRDLRPSAKPSNDPSLAASSGTAVDPQDTLANDGTPVAQESVEFEGEAQDQPARLHSDHEAQQTKESLAPVQIPDVAALFGRHEMQDTSHTDQHQEEEVGGSDDARARKGPPQASEVVPEAQTASAVVDHGSIEQKTKTRRQSIRTARSSNVIDEGNDTKSSEQQNPAYAGPLDHPDDCSKPVEEAQHNLKQLLIDTLRTESEAVGIRQIKRLVKEVINAQPYSTDEMKVELADAAVFKTSGPSHSLRWRLTGSDETKPEPCPPSNDDEDEDGDVIVVASSLSHQNATVAPPEDPDVVQNNETGSEKMRSRSANRSSRKKQENVLHQDQVETSISSFSFDPPETAQPEGNVKEARARVDLHQESPANGTLAVSASCQPHELAPITFDPAPCRAETEIKANSAALQANVASQSPMIARKRKAATEQANASKRQRRELKSRKVQPVLSEAIKPGIDIDQVERSVEVVESKSDKVKSDSIEEDENQQSSPSDTGPWSGLRSRKAVQSPIIEQQTASTPCQQAANPDIPGGYATGPDEDIGTSDGGEGLSETHEMAEGQDLEPANTHDAFQRVSTKGPDSAPKPTPSPAKATFSRYHPAPSIESEHQSTTTSPAQARTRGRKPKNSSRAETNGSDSTERKSRGRRRIRDDTSEASKTRSAAVSKTKVSQGVKAVASKYRPHGPRPGVSKGVKFRHKNVKKRPLSAKQVLRYIIDDNSDDELTLMGM